jgi:hypothetical protein
MTAALILENPIGLEDYRGAIPPQTLATLFATEMAQTPDSYRTFMKAFFAAWTPEREALVDLFARVLKSGEYPRYARASALTYEMIYEQPIRHKLHLLAMPVLLIIGQSDRSVFFRRYARPEDIKQQTDPLPATGRHWAALPSRNWRMDLCDLKANRGPACQPKLWLNTAKPCHPRWSRWRPIARLQAR